MTSTHEATVAEETYNPEWEHVAAAKVKDEHASASTPKRSTRSALQNKLDSILPPHKRYLGRSRKVFLWCLLVLILVLLVLIIGLAAGLSQGSQYISPASHINLPALTLYISSQNLPLPTNTQKHIGDLTYYEAGLGACGEVDGQQDNIVSISHIVFDAAGSSTSTGGNSNDNPLCGLMLRARRFDDEYGAERSIDLKVVDRCTGCEPTDLDTTLGAFERLAPSASGRVDVTWAWLQPVATG